MLIVRDFGVSVAHMLIYPHTPRGAVLADSIAR
jgi:hypothetical protein